MWVRLKNDEWINTDKIVRIVPSADGRENGYQVWFSNDYFTFLPANLTKPMLNCVAFGLP